jgi:hypothetical protein
VLPRWLTLSGWLVAIVCLFGFTFVPLLLFALWMLVLGAASVPRPGERGARRAGTVVPTDSGPLPDRSVPRPA